MAFAEIGELHSILPTDISVVAFGMGVDCPDIHQVFHLWTSIHQKKVCIRERRAGSMAYSRMHWKTW